MDQSVVNLRLSSSTVGLAQNTSDIHKLCRPPSSSDVGYDLLERVADDNDDDKNGKDSEGQRDDDRVAKVVGRLEVLGGVNADDSETRP